MTAPPIGYAIFCESIRRETSGQSTYVGVFNSAINVRKFPTRIRSLSVLINLRILEEVQPDQAEFEFKFPNDMDPVRDSYDLIEVRNGHGMEGEEGIFSLQVIAQFYGVPFLREGPITVTGTLDGKEYKFGGINVTLRDSDET